MHHPIRFATVIDINDDTTTDRVYIYIKVGNFCKSVLPIIDDKQGFFVRTIEQQIIEAPFCEVVEGLAIPSVVSYFTVKSFSSVSKHVSQTECSLEPLVVEKRASKYILNDETEYKIEVAFFTKKDDIEYSIETNSEQLISLGNDTAGVLGTLADLKTFFFSTASVSCDSSVGGICLKTDGGNKMSLDIQVQRGKWKPYIFAFYTLLSSIGVALIAKLSDIISCSLFWGIAAGISSIVLIAYSAASFYKFFNKK